MAETPPAEEGPSSTIRRIWHTLLDTARNRLELFLVEVKEERIRLLELQLLTAAAVICGCMALLMVTLIVVVIFWDTHRLLVLALLAAAYAAGAAAAVWKLRSLLQRWRPFSATLEEFKKDAACFQKPN